MDQKPMEVVIIGGSIAGLMHGIMLKQLGHNVRILERSLTSARASHAAGVGTGAKGHEFFNTYDSTSQPHAFHCPGYQSLDSNSKVKRTLNAPLWVTSWDVVYYRLRALFDGLPSIFCPATPPVSEGSGRARHELGKQVTDVLEDDELLAVTFEDLSKQGQTGTLQAHLVLDASGSYSVARQKMMPDLRRPYAGFVAWRGTVPEGAVSEATQKLFETRFNVFSMSDGYVVGYAVPGENGEMEKGRRLLNYVWYQLIPEDSWKLKRAMTDTSGHTHHNTLPFGKINPELWADQVAYAREVLTPAFLDLVKATEKPFISTVRDSHAPRAAFLNDRLLLVGEAAFLHRPNSGMAMNQAAIHCLLLRDVLEGKLTVQQWETRVMDTGRRFALLSKLISDWFLGGRLSFVKSLAKFVLYMLWQKVLTLRKRVSKL